MRPRALLGLLLANLLTSCATPWDDWEFARGAPVRGSSRTPELAVVFTGGEHGAGTAHTLDVLDRLRIPAAFFLTGDYLAVPEQRAMVRTMLRLGHYVGPHSHAHLLYCAWEDRDHTLVTPHQFTHDLRTNIRELRSLGALGPGERIWFIPPYEWFNEDQVRWSRDLGVTLFNFTPGSGSNRDYIPEGEPGFLPSAEIAAGVLAYETEQPRGLNGFVLLLHLGSERQDQMHDQLETLLRAIQERGYRFRRVDALLASWPG